MLVIVAGIDFVLYRRFVAPLRRIHPPPWLAAVQDGLPPELMQRLGFFANDKASSFLRFAASKPDGIVRICAFGDSFTHGDEVAEDRDYPTLLQALLDQHAPGQFEVLNFGSASFGFHQTFMMWDALGTKYGCDRVLLGPATFFPERDTSFNHAGLRNPYYLHARYVLDGDDVRLVEVVGQTLEERFEQYLRFVPHLDYLRYDRSPPAFVLAALRSDQTISNPFYYVATDQHSEAFETYRRLLRHMAAAAPSVSVAGGDEIDTLVDGLGMSNLESFAVMIPATFPYLAARNHFGPLGNQLLAREYLARIVPGANEALAILRTRDLPSSPRADEARTARPLSRFTSVEVALDGVPVGHFFSGRASRREGSADILHNAGVVSLLCVGGPDANQTNGGSSITEGCFVPFARPLQGPLQICLRAELAGSSNRQCVGHVRLIAPGVSIGRLALDGVTLEDRSILDRDRFLLTVQDPELEKLLEGAQKVTLEVDGVAILSGPPQGVLSPMEASCFRLRGERERPGRRRAPEGRGGLRSRPARE